MITYKLLRDGSWGVIGPVAELAPGPVIVTKKDGSTKQETVARLSKPFASFNGDGQLAIGFLAPRQRNGRSRSRQYDSDRCRCVHCGQLTDSGDDWCQACGRAGYES